MMAFPSPSLSVPTLQPYQFSYGGLTMGPGTAYEVQSLGGLDLPAIRNGDVARSRDQGELVGLDLLGGRDITVQLDVGTDGTSLQHALDALAAVTGPGATAEVPLYAQLPNSSLYAVMCRPRKRTMPVDIRYALGHLAKVAVQFHATDPRVYAAPSLTATVGLPAPSAGMTFPMTFPMTFGSGSGGAGEVTIDNAGNFEMRPVLVITGPVTNPSVENSSLPGAPALTFANPAQTSYTVLAGDQLVIDLDLRTVLYYSGGVSSGTAPASRRNWVVAGSVWWNLAPGNNVLHFLSQDSSATGATLAVQYAAASMI